MTEEVIDRHVIIMPPCSIHQPHIDAQGRQVLIGSLLIQESHNFYLHFRGTGNILYGSRQERLGYSGKGSVESKDDGKDNEHEDDPGPESSLSHDKSPVIPSER